MAILGMAWHGRFCCCSSRFVSFLVFRRKSWLLPRRIVTFSLKKFFAKNLNYFIKKLVLVTKY